jgi:hypothetical protein
MTKEELLKTVWGQACANLGYPVSNAYFYREEGFPATIGDQQIINECQRIVAEQQNPVVPEPVPLASIQAQLKLIIKQLAALSSSSPAA